MTDFAGTDFNQYPSWEVIRAPTGATYYKVPGTGFVYDPFLSSTRGRPVLFPDPRPAQQKRQEEEKQKQDLIDQQKRAQSPLGQIAPTLGIVAGGLGGKYLFDQLSGPTVEAAIPGLDGAVNVVMSDGSVLNSAGQLLSGGGGALTEAGPNLGMTGAQAFFGPGGMVPGGIGPVASGAEYGQMLANNPLAQAGLFDIGGIGSAGNAILPVAGALTAADLFMNKRHGGRGALQGAASGAMIGSYFGGLPGAAIGAGIGALGGYFGNFGDENRFETEWKRKKALFDKGLITEAELGEKPQQGRSKEQLIAEEEAKIAAGLPGNVEFARTRSESALTPHDIQGYAQIIEKASETGLSRLDLAQRALSAGAVREHHGTVDVDWSKVNLDASAASASPELPTDTPGVPRVTPGVEIVPTPAELSGPKRSRTLSPGINMQGQRMTPDEMARALARRADNRRRR